MTETKIILPQDYSPPFNLLDDPIQNEIVLESGFKILQLQKKTLTIVNRSELKLKELEMREEYDKENSILKDEIKTLRERISAIHSLHEKERDKIISDSEKYQEQLLNKLKSTQLSELDEMQKKETSHIETIVNLEKENLAKRIALEEEYKNKLKIIQESFENDLTEMKKINSSLNEKVMMISNSQHETIAMIQKSYEERERKLYDLCNDKQKANDKLAADLSKITENLSKKPSSAVATGIIGEEMIEHWIGELFNSADITNLSNQTAKGDLHVKLHNKKYLIEVKNKLTIVKTDIDKFIRDVETNKDDIHGALFVTINTSNIPNKGDMSLEYIAEIPVIYLYVKDMQTLGVAIKTLSFLNNKSDSSLLTILINELYIKINSLSSNLVTLEKNANDNKTVIETMRKDIKNAVMSLDNLFQENPDLKIEKSIHLLEYTPEEIKIIRNTYTTNKKAKLGDYITALEKTIKYVQDRGGIAKIKSICTNVAPKINFPVAEIPKLDI